MVRILGVILIGLVLAGGMGGGRQDSARGSGRGSGGTPRFVAVDVFIDSGATPLGAWQVEIKAVGGDAKLVGVEGGETAAYKQPPYYDPAALHESQLRERVILAGFSTGGNLPAGKTRVARIHVQVSGQGEPEYTTKLVTAGAADGIRIDAKATATPVDAGGGR